jgi:hypothetical protein
LANQEVGHPSKPQAYTIPLQNTTVSSIRSESLSNKTTLYEGRIGQSCNPSDFPEPAVIKRSGRQQVVECKGGKVSLNQQKKAQKLWKPGDPVFKGKRNHRNPNQNIKSNSFGDEMPDDLPPG